MSIQSKILEGLRYNRNMISEEVTNQSKSAVDKFMKEQKASSDVRKKMTNILNFIYLECNKIGENLFTGGEFDYIRGDMEDLGGPESGPDPILYPSMHTLRLVIKFKDRNIRVEDVWGTLLENIQKNMKSNYKDFEADGHSFDISIDHSMNVKSVEDMLGFFISVDRPRSSSLIITLGHTTNPLNEGEIKDTKTQVSERNDSVLSDEDSKKLEKILLKKFKNPKHITEDSKRVWTEDEVKQLIQTNDKVLYGALRHIYACQTEDEKSSYSTKEPNGIGFNALDADFMTSICKQLEKKGSLSAKQKEYARKKLVKYNKQLTRLANQ